MVFAVIMAPFAIPYELVSKENNAYMQLFLKTLLPSTFGCFCVFAFFDGVCLKLSLYEEKVVESEDEEMLMKPFLSNY